VVSDEVGRRRPARSRRFPATPRTTRRNGGATLAARRSLDLVARRGLEAREMLGLRGVLTDAEVRVALAAAGLRVLEGCPFVGRVHDVYVAGVVGIREGLSPGWVRWLKCHGLGHHLLHPTDRLYEHHELWLRREAEAELFAGVLLFGEVPGPTLDAAALAAAADVEVECVRRWLENPAGLGQRAPVNVGSPRSFPRSRPRE
jgi:hypothetical protein